MKLSGNRLIYRRIIQVLKKTGLLLSIMILALLLNQGPFNQVFPLQSVIAAGDFMYFPNDIFYINENAGSISIPVERERENKFRISANYNTASGTADATSDYMQRSGIITITGSGPSSISINIVNDSTGEIDETFSVALSGSYTLHDPFNEYYSSCTIVIVDDDGGAAQSGNNNLDGILTDIGELIPVFDSAVQEYSVCVAEDISEICLMAYLQDSTATMDVNGITCDPGIWCGPMALNQGANEININVRAENNDIKIYTVTVNRDILPVVEVDSFPMVSNGGNILFIGGSLSFSGEHTVTVTDLSANEWGWKLTLVIGGFISAENIDNPCHPSSGGFLQVEIPLMEWLDCVVIDSIEYPDNEVDNTDISLDLSNINYENGNYHLDIITEHSGIAGDYIINIDLAFETGDWLPGGTIITAEFNGGRFDQDETDINFNEITIQPDEKIQVFASDYRIWFFYVIERILQP